MKAVLALPMALLLALAFQPWLRTTKAIKAMATATATAETFAALQVLS